MAKKRVGRKLYTKQYTKKTREDFHFRVLNEEEVLRLVAKGQKRGRVLQEKFEVGRRLSQKALQLVLD